MNADQILSGKIKDLGGFSVARVLPQVKRRSVGPFIFFDHLGPMTVDALHHLDVRPHPHIGLSTVTYLFAGRGFHRDSLGSRQVISPGDLNWMTAGKGIVHSERTPPEEIQSSPSKTIHGIQIWVGLPKKDEDCDPDFTHYSKQSLPEFKLGNGLNAKILIGKFDQHVSPVKTRWPMMFMELKATSASENNLSFQEKEMALFLVEGEVEVNSQVLQKNDLIVVADPTQIHLKMGKNTRVIVVGGEPFPEPRYMWWNLVSSDKQKIRNAAKAWEEQRMGQVPEEVDYIPLPTDPLP